MLDQQLPRITKVIVNYCGHSRPRSDLRVSGGVRPASAAGRFSGDRFSLKLTPTLLPAAIVIQPAESLVNNALPSTVPGHAVYGFAVAPLGLTAELARRHRIHPFLETMEGMIASTEPIPERQPNATGLNFLLDGGAGICWSVRQQSAVSFGYRFLHIADAGTTSFNPGINNNVIYVGYSFLR